MTHHTTDGRVFDFSKEQIGDIRISDVLRLIAKERRYSNQIEWTVLQHSIAVGYAAQILYSYNEPLIRAAYTHDFGEAFYRDVPTPFKRMVGKAWDVMTHEVDSKLFAALKLDIELGDEDHELLNQIDIAVGYVEALQFHSQECADAYSNIDKIPPATLVAATKAIMLAGSIPIFSDEEEGELSDEVISIYLQVAKTVVLI